MPKTNAQKQREYRQRLRAKKPPRPPAMTTKERVRLYRERKKLKKIEEEQQKFNNTMPSTSNASHDENQQVSIIASDHLSLILEEEQEGSSCKEKWKNIRGSLSRHLRRQQTETGKRKKDYYLAKHLDFLIPFTKTRSSVGTYDSQSNDDVECFAVEPPQYAVQNIKIEPAEEDDIMWEQDLESEPVSRTKRKAFDLMDISSRDLPPKQHNYDEEIDPDLSFFRSLLPDVRLMTRTQKNKFKVIVINSLENILSGTSTSATDGQPFSDCSSSQQQ